MSLRSRLILAVTIALAISLALACTSACWRAGRSVSAELRAALSSGVQTVRAGLDDAVLAADPVAEARRLVRAFDGSRHARAFLLDGSGNATIQSQLLRPTTDVPRWFEGLIAPSFAPVDAAIDAGPSGRIVIRLQADPMNEVGEVWDQFRDVAMALATFFVVASLLGSWTIQRALRPIGRLQRGFSRIGAEDYTARISEDGACELAALARGFNGMAKRLAETQAQNARLNEQLITLQEEERADLARDLHDEIGPSLFAVKMSAATIAQLAHAGRTSEIPGHARAIQDVTAQMQQCVKLILGRLRAARAVDFGLKPAVDDLVAFWSVRNSRIAFDVAVTVDEAHLGDLLKETIYRVVQEGVLNAVRHGQPSRIEVSITGDRGSVVVQVTDDGASSDGLTQPGFGLNGMRERITALNGTLSIGLDDQGSGWRIVAHLPLSPWPCGAPT